MGGGSFSLPPLPGWFLEAAYRWVAALACLSQRYTAEKFRSARSGGRLIVFAASGFHAHGVCALIARLLKALVGGNAAALGVRARQHRATIGSRPVSVWGER